MSTIGINQELKSLRIDNKNIYQLILWDTAGQEQYRSMPRKYYRNADGILLLFDINDKKTFEDIEVWMQDIIDNTIKNNAIEGENDLIIYLLGNKIDLINKDKDEDKEKVTRKEIEELANKLKVKYYDISCKWNLNLEEIMARIVLDCLKNNRFKKIDKDKPKEENSGGCCGSNKKINKNDEKMKLKISK